MEGGKVESLVVQSADKWAELSVLWWVALWVDVMAGYLAVWRAENSAGWKAGMWVYERVGSRADLMV